MLPAGTGRYREEAPEIGEEIELDLVAKVEWLATVPDWRTAQSIHDFHVWEQRVVRDRLEYEEDRALWLALVRVYQTPAPRRITMARGLLGCRSWIDLDPGGSRLDDRSYDLRPVIGDVEFAELSGRVREFVGGGIG